MRLCKICRCGSSKAVRLNLHTIDIREYKFSDFEVNVHFVTVCDVCLRDKAVNNKLKVLFEIENLL